MHCSMNNLCTYDTYSNPMTPSWWHGYPRLRYDCNKRTNVLRLLFRALLSRCPSQGDIRQHLNNPNLGISPYTRRLPKAIITIPGSLLQHILIDLLQLPDLLLKARHLNPKKSESAWISPTTMSPSLTHKCSKNQRIPKKEK